MATQVDMRKLIEFAVKAPSGHNTQTWCFQIGDNIEVIFKPLKEVHYETS
jgi:hypothetical protein